MIKYLALMITKLLGMKTFMVGIFMTVIGVVVYNLVVEIVEEILTFVLAKMGAVSASGVVGPTISGFGAWVAVQLRLPECLSVLVTFTALGFILRKIPFIRW